MLKIFIVIINLFMVSIMLNASDFYDFSFKSIDGKDIELKNYKNKVVLLVNTASMCGFTKQYNGLQDLYENYRDKGFVILGLPSNSFLQEYTSEDKVKDFCESKFNITFPMTKIIEVLGENKHPFYKWLQLKYEVKPRWNFHKFIFNKEGKLVKAFSSLTKPGSEKIKKVIESELSS